MGICSHLSIANCNFDSSGMLGVEVQVATVPGQCGRQQNDIFYLIWVLISVPTFYYWFYHLKTEQNNELAM